MTLKPLIEIDNRVPQVLDLLLELSLQDNHYLMLNQKVYDYITIVLHKFYGVRYRMQLHLGPGVHYFEHLLFCYPLDQ
jgi:hypothetical protein